MNTNNNEFSISNIGKRLNRDRTSIVKWEKKGIIPPARRKPNGYRYYTNKDLEKIKKILSNDNFYKCKPKR